MAKYSQKMMGKEVGSAQVYAEPHTMKGKKVSIETNPGKPTNSSKAETYDMTVGNISRSAGNEKVKTDGIKQRGSGAATRGFMSRGPMA
jgi:hypothetical protein